jgi:hypothetical protein
MMQDLDVRRSIDDEPMAADDVPPGDEGEFRQLSWAVAISDDYDDAEVRIVLTVEEVGRRGQGLAAHLPPASARRLRVALRDALREVGADPGP